MSDRFHRVSDRFRRPARRFRPPPLSLSGWQAARAKARAKYAAHAADKWFVIGGPSCTDTPLVVKCLRVVRYGDFWYTKSLAEVLGPAYASEARAVVAARKTVTGRVARLEQSLRKAKANLKRLEKVS